MNTDLTYASKEDFQTDAQIAAAKQNGEVAFQLISLDDVHPGKKTPFESSFFHLICIPCLLNIESWFGVA